MTVSAVTTRDVQMSWIQNQRLKVCHSFEDGIVRNRTGSLRMRGGRGL
jgi:hypothetical protein